MNPYINQGNQNNPYLQNAYNQQNFMGNLPPELQSMQFDQQNNPAIMANLMKQRQMYGQSQAQAQQQQLPFNSPGNSSNPSVTGSPALPNMQSPQHRQPGVMNPQQSMMQQSPPQQQQWVNKQQQIPLMGMQQMDPQQRQQLLMMQQQQQQQLLRKQQQLFQQPQLPPQQQPMTIPSNSMSPKTNHTGSPIPPVESIDADINSKRVDAVLTLNIEIIRLCIESQRIGSNLEPNIGLYQAKLQSNLTYLATMADVSMAKPGEDYKAPPHPDFSGLPPPQSEIGKKIHELYHIAQKLFEIQPVNSNSPQSQSQSPSLQRNSQQQQLLRQQAAAMRQQQQQQFLRNTSNKSGSNSANSSATGTPNIPVNGISNMDPQSVLRQNAQQTMMQQQQQQLRQQQQQQQMMMMSSSPTNSNPSMTGFSPSPNTTLPPAQQMSPSDLLAANGMINPANTMMNNIMLNPNNLMMNPNNMYNNNNGNTMEDPNNYNVMMMMQRLQQQQQQQQQQHQ